MPPQWVKLKDPDRRIDSSSGLLGCDLKWISLAAIEFDFQHNTNLVVSPSALFCSNIPELTSIDFEISIQNHHHLWGDIKTSVIQASTLLYHQLPYPALEADGLAPSTTARKLP